MAETRHYLNKFTARKVHDDHPDSLQAWMSQYLQLVVTGVRSAAVAQKIALHLARFLEYFQEAYGHDRISTCLKRDIVAWQTQMQADGLAHSTINNHLASLSSFCTWVHARAPQLFPTGDLELTRFGGGSNVEIESGEIIKSDENNRKDSFYLYR